MLSETHLLVWRVPSLFPTSFIARLDNNYCWYSRVVGHKNVRALPRSRLKVISHVRVVPNRKETNDDNNWPIRTIRTSRNDWTAARPKMRRYPAFLLTVKFQKLLAFFMPIVIAVRYCTIVIIFPARVMPAVRPGPSIADVTKLSVGGPHFDTQPTTLPRQQFRRNARYRRSLATFQKSATNSFIRTFLIFISCFRICILESALRYLIWSNRETQNRLQIYAFVYETRVFCRVTFISANSRSARSHLSWLYFSWLQNLTFLPSQQTLH